MPNFKKKCRKFQAIEQCLRLVVLKPTNYHALRRKIQSIKSRHKKIAESLSQCLNEISHPTSSIFRVYSNKVRFSVKECEKILSFLERSLGKNKPIDTTETENIKDYSKEDNQSAKEIQSNGETSDTSVCLKDATERVSLNSIIEYLSKLRPAKLQAAEKTYNEWRNLAIEPLTKKSQRRELQKLLAGEAYALEKNICLKLLEKYNPMTEEEIKTEAKISAQRWISLDPEGWFAVKRKEKYLIDKGHFANRADAHRQAKALATSDRYNFEKRKLQSDPDRTYHLFEHYIKDPTPRMPFKLFLKSRASKWAQEARSLKSWNTRKRQLQFYEKINQKHYIAFQDLSKMLSSIFRSFTRIDERGNNHPAREGFSLAMKLKQIRIEARKLTWKMKAQYLDNLWLTKDALKKAQRDSSLDLNWNDIKDALDPDSDSSEDGSENENSEDYSQNGESDDDNENNVSDASGDSYGDDSCNFTEESDEESTEKELKNNSSIDDSERDTIKNNTTRKKGKVKLPPPDIPISDLDLIKFLRERGKFQAIFCSLFS